MVLITYEGSIISQESNLFHIFSDINFLLRPEASWGNFITRLDYKHEEESFCFHLKKRSADVPVASYCRENPNNIMDFRNGKPFTMAYSKFSRQRNC
jgi:hypothetical protein